MVNAPFSSREANARVHLRAFRRLQQIDREVRAGKFPNSKSLAHLLEVNERTIKRDLMTMRDQFNAPLVYDCQRRGFRYAEPGWSLPLVRLSEGDLLAFFIAEHALRLTGHQPEAVQLKNALAKLTALLPEQVSVNLSTLGENVSFQNVPFAAADPQTLQRLARAAINQELVEFDYYSPHNKAHSHRLVGVLTLHNFAGDWFVICRDEEKNAERDFHVGRIQNLRETNLPFDPPTKWNAAEYLQSGFFMMRGGRLTTVQVLFDAHQAQWIRERAAFHQNERREELPHGALRLSFQIGESGLEAVARWCLQYAGNCRVEKPEKLRKLVREKLLKGLEEHQ